MGEHERPVGERATGEYPDPATINYHPAGTISSDALIESRHKDAFYAARDFMVACGIPNPTPDAISQLLEAFLPALKIMCDPSHPWDPGGATWRQSGVLGILTDCKKKFERLWERGWKHGKRHDDSAFDLLNFVGFYLRSADNGWGEWGNPKVPNGE